MHRKFRRPCFTVRIESAGCRYDVRLNDVPVDSHEAGTGMTVDIPVNPTVFTGDNLLAVLVFPGEAGAEEFRPDARLRIDLCLREMEDRAKHREVMGTIEFGGDPPEGTGEKAAEEEHPVAIERIAENMVLLERTIPLETPFPLWTWMTAPRIPSPEAIQPLLLRELRAFHTSLASGDRSSVVARTKAKAKEFGRAFHGDEHDGHHLIGYLRNLEDPKMRLLPLDEKGLRLERFGGGRLARFVTPSGHGPIAFRMGDHPVASYMNTVYCLDKHGHWLQIR